MALTPSLTRAQLASVFKDDRIRLAFETLLQQVAGLPPDLANVNFVVTAADAAAPNAHVITAGAGVSVVGGSGTVTISLTGAVVTQFSGGSTGLTPAAPTAGAITLGGTLAMANGGTGQTTKAAAFNALSPITSTGDLIIGSGANTASRLAAGSSGTVLKIVSGSPAWVAAGASGYLSSSVAAGSAVTLTSTLPADITSLALTAGDWDVEGNVWTLVGGGATMTAIEGWVSTTSATAPTRPNGGGDAQLAGVTLTASQNAGIATGAKRITVATTATVYLSANGTFSGGTAQAYGFLRAQPVT